MASTVSKIQDSPQAGVLTIGELTRTIARNKGVFWSTLIIGLLIGVGVSLLMPKSYAALTEVLIEGPSPNGVNATPDNILEGLTVPGSSYSMATQLELLQSQDIFFKVLEASNIPQPRTLADLEDLPKITIRQKKDSNVYIVVAEGANDEQAATVAGNYPQVFADYLTTSSKSAFSVVSSSWTHVLAKSKQLSPKQETITLPSSSKITLLTTLKIAISAQHRCHSGTIASRC
ncbi:MAG: Wzz/FepE/Etk N-terminal domain-containing protein [Fimbriimonadaceae bacterium]